MDKKQVIEKLAEEIDEKQPVLLKNFSFADKALRYQRILETMAFLASEFLNQIEDDEEMAIALDLFVVSFENYIDENIANRS